MKKKIYIQINKKIKKARKKIFNSLYLNKYLKKKKIKTFIYGYKPSASGIWSINDLCVDSKDFKNAINLKRRGIPKINLDFALENELILEDSLWKFDFESLLKNKQKYKYLNKKNLSLNFLSIISKKIVKKSTEALKKEFQLNIAFNKSYLLKNKFNLNLFYWKITNLFFNKKK